MANAANLRQAMPTRGLILGYPGSGKTGALVALANQGLKLRVLAFDKEGNMATLINLTKSEFLKNIDIIYLEDKLMMGGKTIETTEKPHAFADAFRLLDRWKYKEPDGTEIDLGPSREWGLDTVVVLDTLSSMGDAAMRRARFLNNSTLLSTADRTYGLAMAEQEAFVERMMSSGNRHHSWILSHTKMIGPRDVRKGEDALTEQIKRGQAEIIGTRLYPNALGWQLPQQIGRHFPIVLEAERRIGVKRNVHHVLKTITNKDMDLRMPAADFPAEMDTDIALVKVFDAVSPGWRAAVEASKGP